MNRPARSLGSAVVFLISFGCGGDAPKAPTDFQTAASAYEVVGLIRGVDEADEEAALFTISDIIEVDGDFIVSESRNSRLTRLGGDLRVLSRIGGEGDGPGEYKHPSALAISDSHLVVLDFGNSRLTYLSRQGDFKESFQLPGNIHHLALHADLGPMATSAYFEGYYLQRVGAGGAEAFAPIPSELMTERRAASLMSHDLVAVTPNGEVHVLDEPSAAVVSYSADGSLTRVRYLPDWFRAAQRQERESFEKAYGGRIVGMSLTADLSAMPDGRLFMIAHQDDMIGFVLDLEANTATRVLAPTISEASWFEGGAGGIFDGERLSLFNLAEVAVFETRLASGTN